MGVEGKGAAGLLRSYLAWTPVVPCQGEWLRRDERYHAFKGLYAGLGCRHVPT